MSRRLVGITLFVISLSLNFRSGLLFSSSRQNSRFLKDFDLSSSESVSSDSNESEAIIVTGSQNEKVNISNNGKLLQLHEDEGLRVILCPEQNNLLMRYDLRAGQCAEIDTQAHCGRNMLFKEEMDSSSYGYCECDFENHPVPLVFHPSTYTCYPIYSQAYCKPGDWLILNKEAKGPVCQRNQCLPHPQQGLPTNRNGRLSRAKQIFPWIWESISSKSGHDPVIKIKDNKSRKSSPLMSRLLVPLNGNGPCLLLGMESKYCDNRNEKVIFSQGDIAPRCAVPGKSFRRLSIIPNACPPGSYYSIIGYCQPVWDF